ncbi:MAG: C1 family peptidase [Ferruginibacter sp.]
MKKFSLLLVSACSFIYSFAQTDEAIAAGKMPVEPLNFTVIKKNAVTPVKNQAATGTCWSFSTTSLVESQALKNNLGEFDLSEIFTVRNIYLEKAKNYVLRQGYARFAEGGLGHDQIKAIAKYGTMPESVYSGLLPGKKNHDHQKLVADLKKYLDSIIKLTPVPLNWPEGFTAILDAALGKPPAEFDYNGKKHNPQSFAKDVLHFDANDYVMLTSFTHHPFYEPFILEVPDNFSNGSYMNIPVEELIQITKDALNKGYTVSWDADVSNKGFMQGKGIAGFYDTAVLSMINKAPWKKMQKKPVPAGQTISSDMQMAKQQSNGNDNQATVHNVAVIEQSEVAWDASLRQALFENLTTQDDHLMHIVGIEKSADGRDFFIVKNSWGKVGPDNGYINVSESYFGVNTISLVVPKAAISKAMLDKMNMK